MTFAMPTGFPSFLPPHPYHTSDRLNRDLWLHSAWSIRLVETNSIWAVGSKLSFGVVRQSEGILATSGVDRYSTYCICVASSQYCVLNFCVCCFLCGFLVN
jgi:hypothetical protein